MGDEDVGKAETLAQIGQQPDDLHLDRDVERRDGFVAHDQFGFARQRARNRDALALPAGKLVGMAVGMRISATDWVEGGWEIEQSVRFAHELKARGCDFIHVSTGGLSPLQQIALEPGYQIAYAQRIKRETGMPTIGVGLITEPEHAERILQDGEADVIGLARAMLYDPRWPWHAAARLGDRVFAPPQYWRSQPREHKALFG